MSRYIKSNWRKLAPRTRFTLSLMAICLGCALIGSRMLLADPVDVDLDGISDAWELLHSLDPADAADAALDPDLDSLTNLEEYTLGTDLK